MSFDVYLQCFSGGKAAGLPVDEVRRIFGNEFLDERDPEWWNLQYDDCNSCAVYLSRDDSDMVTSLSISCPCADRRLWLALLELMKSGGMAMYWPGVEHFLVTDTSVPVQLPKDILEEFGAPVVVETPEQVLSHIRAS